MNVEDWIEDSIIFEYLAGSHSYGLNTESSDEDYRAVCIAPKEYYLGMLNFEQHEDKSKEDRIIYDIKKLISLAKDCNPNIIEALFAPEDCITHTTDIWERIRAQRYLFLTKKAKFTYSGYAFAQLKRIKTHRAWLLNPPTAKPERSDYGLTDGAKMSPEYMGYIESTATVMLGEDTDKQLIINGTIDISGLDLGLNKRIMQLYDAERKYRQAKNHWDQFQSWKTNRNPKRSELEAKFGYDTKHASHIFRLLIQGEEILRHGELSVRMQPVDRDFCKAVKAGKYTYEEILQLAEDQNGRLDELYTTSTIPRDPDFNAINALLVSSIEDFYRGRFKTLAVRSKI